MEEVRKFDAEWKKQNAWEFLMRRVCLVLFYSIGSCLMLLPFGSSAWALVSSVMLFLGAMHFYIAPYMRCVENGKSVSLPKGNFWQCAGGICVSFVWGQEYSSGFYSRLVHALPVPGGRKMHCFHWLLPLLYIW